MTDRRSVTQARLNAFIDNELDDAERLEILNLINQDPELRRTVNEIRLDMDLLATAYRQLPVSRAARTPDRARHGTQRARRALAASVMLGIGLVAGWFIASHAERGAAPAFTAVDSFHPNASENDRILIHVSSLDRRRVSAALDKLEEILDAAEKNHRRVKLEFIANAEGVAVLGEGSPYADKIKALSAKHHNVEFLACGIAMETVRLKDKHDMVLLPEAKRIPAALNEILDKLKAGWTYMHS
jgi:intracellular sulfur oxidation DsrE/DsrF family protein